MDNPDSEFFHESINLDPTDQASYIRHNNSACRTEIFMPASRATYSIAPEVLQRFNALVPSSERSRCVQALMESILERREKP